MKGDVLRDICYYCVSYMMPSSRCYYFQCWARDNFLASRQRQCDNVLVKEPRGQKKIGKILRSRCLNEVAKTNIVKTQYLSTLRPDTWSRCRDRVVACPALIYFTHFSNHSNQSLTAWYTWNHRIAWQRREFCPAEAPASCSSCLKWSGCKLCFKHFYVTHRVLINI